MIYSPFFIIPTSNEPSSRKFRTIRKGITGHQKGIFSKLEFQQAMESFLAIIQKRDETIDKYVRQGLTFEELSNIGIFYPKKALKETILKTWEQSGIRKHLNRLGLPVHESNGELVNCKIG